VEASHCAPEGLAATPGCRPRLGARSQARKRRKPQRPRKATTRPAAAHGRPRSNQVSTLRAAARRNASQTRAPRPPVPCATRRWIARRSAVAPRHNNSAEEPPLAEFTPTLAVTQRGTRPETFVGRGRCLRGRDAQKKPKRRFPEEPQKQNSSSPSRVSREPRQCTPRNERYRIDKGHVEREGLPGYATCHLAAMRPAIYAI
jgi:hypothetical protein